MAKFCKWKAYKKLAELRNPPPVAADYYLNPVSGSNSNDGLSPETAWLTLAYALANAPDGSEVSLADGNYGALTESASKNRTDWLQLTAAGTGAIISSVTLGDYAEPYTYSYLRLNGVSVSGAVSIPYVYNFRMYDCVVNPNVFTMNTYGIMGRNTSFVVINNCEVVNAWRGIYAWGDTWTITNNNVHHIVDNCVHSVGSHHAITDNELHDNYSTYGTDGTHTSGIHVEAPAIDDIIIRRNKVYDYEHQGINIYGKGDLTNAVVEGNLVYNNAVSSNVIISGCVGAKINNNTIINKNGTGLRFEVTTGHNYTNTIAEFYNNIVSSLLVDTNTAEHAIVITANGNNIFGNNPTGQGGTTNFQPVNSLISQTLSSGYFLSYAGNNYKLITGSNAILQGSTTYLIDSDIAGDTQERGAYCGCYSYQSAWTLVDHTWCTSPALIPDTYRDLVKANVKAILVGQSHGHQFSHYGMDDIQTKHPTFTRHQHYGLPLDATSALDLCVTFGASAWDHVFPNQYWCGASESAIDWYLATYPEYIIAGHIEDNPDINVAMHTWCYQLRSSTSAFIVGYLYAMNKMEADYPEVTFLYQTAHAQFRTDDTTSGFSDTDGFRVHKNNELIRDYCFKNDRVLIDSADMDIYAPYTSGLVTDLDSNTWIKESDRTASGAITWDGISYNPATFPTIHLAAWGPYDGIYAHTTRTHNEAKARAIWNLFAVLQGWER